MYRAYMDKDFNSPRYGDVVTFVCLLFPLIITFIGLILGGNDGVAIAGSILLFAIVIYLPIASLVFACIRKKLKRAHACILSTSVGLIAICITLSIIAYGLMGPSIGILGPVLGLLILCVPYVLCVGVYLILLKHAKKIDPHARQAGSSERSKQKDEGGCKEVE